MPKNSEPDLNHIPGPRYTDTPSTYFFYELEGPNSVEPIHLYWDGLVLWHEQAAEIIYALSTGAPPKTSALFQPKGL